jgi:hypothetical protein
MTGRVAGFCAGFNQPGFMNQMPGRGFGMGFARGGGFGRRNRCYHGGMAGWQNYGVTAPRMSREQEIELLKNQADSLQDALKDVNEQIGRLESDSKE